MIWKRADDEWIPGTEAGILRRERGQMMSDLRDRSRYFGTGKRSDDEWIPGTGAGILGRERGQMMSEPTGP